MPKKKEGKTVTIRLNGSELEEYESLSKKLNISIGKAIKWGSSEFHFNQKSSDIKEMQMANHLLASRERHLGESLNAILDVINDRFLYHEGEFVNATPFDMTEEFAVLWNSNDMGVKIQHGKTDTDS